MILDYQKLRFDCIESYKQWLEDHQHQTLTRFTIWYSNKKTDSLFSQRLICHRSRHTRTSLSVDSRKRCLKLSGYKRLGGICPAEIRLVIEKDGSCSVTYQTTHVGHNIGDESELKHMFLTNEEKKKIAAEIQSGTPLAQIVKRKCAKSDSGKNFSRLDLVSRADIRNVAISHKLSLKIDKVPQPARSLTDLEVKIAEHEEDILFFKRQTEEDSRFNVLQEEDFALVIMTSNQEKYLRSYGHRVVCLDNIHTSSSRGFYLHTLLVLDEDDEALPAAFLLANRDDQCVIDIFLMCVQDRVGIVEPHTLMTNLQSSYYDSWVKIMNNPSYYLLGSWHVHEAWRKNYSKISNKEKRADVRAELLRLSCELDPVRFEDGLNAFLSRDDDELTTFQQHFRQNYVSSAQRWATCYRTTADISHNMAYKSFYMSFRHNLAVGKETQSLNQCLVFIFDHLTSLQTKMS